MQNWYGDNTDNRENEFDLSFDKVTVAGHEGKITEIYKRYKR
ncbi:hypothetical protein [Hufsiella arboris]|nr:hypothetical protein [Hufsiella arboris]